MKWGPCISDSQMRKPSSAKNTSRAQGHKASKGWSPGFNGLVPGSIQVTEASHVLCGLEFRWILASAQPDLLPEDHLFSKPFTISSCGMLI